MNASGSSKRILHGESNSRVCNRGSDNFAHSRANVMEESTPTKQMQSTSRHSRGITGASMSTISRSPTAMESVVRCGNRPRVCSNVSDGTWGGEYCRYLRFSCISWSGMSKRAPINDRLRKRGASRRRNSRRDRELSTRHSIGMP